MYQPAIAAVFERNSRHHGPSLGLVSGDSSKHQTESPDKFGNLF